MMYDNSQVYNQTMHIAMKVLETGAKLGGEIAKTVLLTALEKVKETKENKTGLTILKNLLKSKEELGVIKINKDNLPEFKSKAKKLGVTFASISSENSNEVKIMYKTRQTNQVKECLMEMLEHEQANKLDEIQENSTMVNQSKNNEEANKLDTIQENTTYSELNNHLDFPGVNDGYYRQEIKNTTNEESNKLSEDLKAKGIENDIVVTRVNDDNTFNILLRINEKEKDKVKDIINGKEVKLEKGKEPLDKLIKKAEAIKEEKRNQAIEKTLEATINKIGNKSIFFYICFRTNFLKGFICRN